MKVKVNYKGKLRNGEIVEQREDKYKVRILDHMGQFLAFDWFENRQLRRLWFFLFFMMLHASLFAQKDHYVFIVQRAAWDDVVRGEYEDNPYIDFEGFIEINDDRVLTKTWKDRNDRDPASGTFYILEERITEDNSARLRIEMETIGSKGRKYTLIFDMYKHEKDWVLSVICEDYRLSLAGTY